MSMPASESRVRTTAAPYRGAGDSRPVCCTVAAAFFLLGWAVPDESRAHDGHARYAAVNPDGEPWGELTLPDREVGRAVRQGMPLTAEQIEKILGLVAAYRETVERASRPVPELRSREISLSLEAGEPAPVVTVQMGYTTAVVFIDATGEAWPVSTLLVEETFGPAEGEPGGHVVYVTPAKRFLHGNAVVELAELSTPIVFELAAGNGVVDSRLLVRIPRPGPNADPIVMERTEEFGPVDAVISSFLHGRAPAEAMPVEVRGGNRRDRAWRLESAIYLRTGKTLLAPQAQAFERGVNGDTVYRLADTPYAVVSLDGARVRLEFGGQGES